MAAPQATQAQMQTMLLQFHAGVNQFKNRLQLFEGRLVKGGEDKDDKSLVDKKLFLLEIFTTQKQIFREWVEVFVDLQDGRPPRGDSDLWRR